MTTKKDLVVKSNQLILASYSLTLVEQRLILMAIVTAREKDTEVTAETLLKVRAEDYAKHFNVTRQAAYMALAEATETLFNRRVKVEVFDPERDAMRPLSVRWLTGVDYDSGEGMITVRFGLELIPHITRLEASFTSYELKQISDLKSGYAIRLYELLIKWRVSGKTPVMPLESFREQIGLLTDEYKRMGDFKKNVLDLAVQQINLFTDIHVTYEQIKAGRTITGFSFQFKPKDKGIVLNPESMQIQDADKAQRYVAGLAGMELMLFKDLKKKSPEMTEEKIRKIAKKQNVSELTVIQNLIDQLSE